MINNFYVMSRKKKPGRKPKPKTEEEKIVDSYLDADDSYLVNDDPDLIPIRISLPRPPKLSLIDGCGLKPTEQYFKRQQVPDRLLNLELRIKDELLSKADDNKTFRVTGFKIQQRIHEELAKNLELYKKEIEWINKQWWHRLHGYWFFNKGKPTYIPGWYYFYLNYWYNPSIKGGYPEYRERDRKWFLYNKYVYDCKETFADLDKDGKALKGEDGKYRMTKTHKKIFIGTMNNKQRRAGDTSKALCIEHEVAINNPGTFAGMMSYNSEQAEKTFKMMFVSAWREIPLFLKPYYDGTNKPAEKLIYDVPPHEMYEKGINTIINYAPSGEAKAYDGKKLCFLLVDEAGKTKDININDRHSTLRHCFAQGNEANIEGFCIYPSTVEEMTEEGGAAYKAMADQSNFYYRVPETGSTVTGLALHFYSAADCLEGFVDKYGHAVLNEPTKEQKDEGFEKGSLQHLQGKLDYLLRKGDPESINVYRQEKRKFPIYYRDSWIGNTGSIGFDILKIDKRIAEINADRANLMPVRGDFIGNLDNPMWQPNPDSGKFYCSLTIPIDNINKKIRYVDYDIISNNNKYCWKPMGVNGVVNFTLGVDPFTFLPKSEHKKIDDSSKLSRGGGAMYWYDESLDPVTKPIEERISDRYVLTYLYRPATLDEFVCDMIKAAVYFGAYIYPEINKEGFVEKVIQLGYGGYLSYDIDQNTGRISDKPGIYLQNQKSDEFSMFQAHIYHRCHAERHPELLEDAKNISSIDHLTNYDRFAAALHAKWGSKNNYSKVMRQRSSGGVTLMDLSKGISGFGRK